MQTSALIRTLGGDASAPLRFVGLLIVLGVLILLAYAGLGAGGGAGPAMLLLAVSLAAALVGGTVGFLFGIPRFDYGDARPAPEPSPGPVDLAPVGAAAAAKAAKRIFSYRPSTNLEEVADWLTKIIVGLGLVQLTKVGPELQKLSTVVAAGCSGPCASEPFIAAVVIYSVAGGLLFGYLWTRLHYGRMAAESDLAIHRSVKDADAQSVVAFGIGGPPALARTGADAREATGTEPVEADGNKGQFGGSPVANGRVLRAAIEPSELQSGLYRVSLAVSSLDPGRPLRGSVTFHLHETFKQNAVTREVQQGVASLTVIAYGAFTVGAVADGGSTRLELDLAEHPEAPADFRNS